jgi:hypothetical protein
MSIKVCYYTPLYDEKNQLSVVATEISKRAYYKVDYHFCIQLSVVIVGFLNEEC